jgi:aerobic carbon-monoxide dehydrogenase small subunit
MIGTLNIATTDAEAVPVSITVNGRVHQVTVPAHRLLVDFLRNDLHLTGTKVGCETGQCGACTVLLDGVAVKGCTVLAVQADGAAVTTIEGLATDGALTKVQTALWEEHGVQCGYCTPAMVLAMTDLLNINPHPTEHEIRMSMDGIICRCGVYQNVVRAVQTLI